MFVGLQDTSWVAKVVCPRHDGNNDLIAILARFGANNVQMSSFRIVCRARRYQEGAGARNQSTRPSHFESNVDIFEAFVIARQLFGVIDPYAAHHAENSNRTPTTVRITPFRQMIMGPLP